MNTATILKYFWPFFNIMHEKDSFKSWCNLKMQIRVKFFLDHLLNIFLVYGRKNKWQSFDNHLVSHWKKWHQEQLSSISTLWTSRKQKICMINAKNIKFWKRLLNWFLIWKCEAKTKVSKSHWLYHKGVTQKCSFMVGIITIPEIAILFSLL